MLVTAPLKLKVYFSYKPEVNARITKVTTEYDQCLSQSADKNQSKSSGMCGKDT